MESAEDIVTPKKPNEDKRNAKYCRRMKWRIVLITEITADDQGVRWYGEGKRQFVVIHGKRSAVMLNTEWAAKWREEGEKAGSEKE